MKSNTTKLANTFGLTMAILWVLCSAIVWLFPDFSLQLTSWWMHGMNLSAMGGRHLTLGNFLLGGIVAVVSAWVTGWVLGWSWQVVGEKNRE
ncbi:MAG: DUF5676 family membrane protein [Patescibacteria group bacterium]|nr:hypothetical protein [Patescibacteria group bacterium]